VDFPAIPVVSEPVPPPSGPACVLCAEPALVNWLRRPTDDELAEVVKAEQDRRDQIRLLADPQLPEPEFGPLPTAEGTTRTVYACGPHAISMDAAALVHASSCTAPNDADLPGCDCTPEPPPDAPPEEEPVQALPDHWVTGGA
jgi:hypothetical protein